jgi:hypothetical protein
VTGRQLRLLDVRTIQSVSHLSQRTSKLRGHFGDSVHLASDRPEDPRDAPALVRLGVAPVKGGYDADRVVHDVPVGRAHFDEWTARQLLHDKRSNIREILDRFREARGPSSFAE